MKIEKIALSSLHKTEKNIRRHSKTQIAEYVRSLEMFGQIRPLVATDDGEILVGNGMYEAMQELGWSECDAYVLHGLTTAQKRKLMLADNRVFELDMTDANILEDIIADLDGDFDVPGYDTDLLECLSIDDVADVKIAQEIESYGSDFNTKEEQEDEVVYASEVNENQYAPPVKNDSGEFIPPPATAQKIIVCPHCGEKICL